MYLEGSITTEGDMQCTSPSSTPWTTIAIQTLEVLPRRDLRCRHGAFVGRTVQVSSRRPTVASSAPTRSSNKASKVSFHLRDKAETYTHMRVAVADMQGSACCDLFRSFCRHFLAATTSGPCGHVHGCCSGCSCACFHVLGSAASPTCRDLHG